METLPVLAATPRFVIVDKPAWLLSVPGRGPDRADCVAARVARLFPHARGPLIVHRLDMETSGLMVLALDPEAQRDLSAQFERRTVEKEYVALIQEAPLTTPSPGETDALPGRWHDPLAQGDAGILDLPLRPDLTCRPVQIVDHARGRPARTRWRVLAREVDRLRVCFVPYTGRTHQIRVHAAVGLRRPIVGDVLYGGEPASRIMLHAWRLAFREPGTSRRLEFCSPPPF